MPVLVVRHGESTWNAHRRWQGQADPPLSELGERQARTAGASLAVHGRFTAVATSTLQRARRTGELLSEVAGIPLGDERPELMERFAGAWQGLTRVEIEQRDPGFLESGERPEGYEDDSVVAARAVPAIVELAAAFDAAQAELGAGLVIVSHGGVIGALERHAGAARGATWSRLENLDGRWFEVRDGDVRVSGPRVRLL